MKPRIQAICAKELSNEGTLVWSFEAMERWQQIQLFYKHYQGDFTEQWWHLSCAEKGLVSYHPF